MATITEDYVSFETAKLLKEKGFKTPVETGYYGDGRICHNLALDFMDYNHEDGYYSRPTIQMAMKWLREVHNLCIEPYRTASGYLYTISKIWTGSEIYSDEFNGDDEDSGQWTTYEKACEAAIKYCLENLI